MSEFRWEFEQSTGWNGWTPNAAIVDVELAPEGIGFRGIGSDPQIASPPFELAVARNTQHVEIEMECDRVGAGELFFTNKTTGRYGGLEPDWMCRVPVPSPGRHTLRVYPFWEGLGCIVKVRFDPPSGARCRLYSISIVAPEAVAVEPAWRFDGQTPSWDAGYAASLEAEKAGLRVTALAPQALIRTHVAPFDAARRSVLRIDAECAGESCLAFYWARDDAPGLFGVPIPLDGEGRAPRDGIDLRRHSEWRGRITHLAIAFGTFGGEVLSIRSLAVDDNDPTRPFLNLRHFGFADPGNRPSDPATVSAVVEHAGGPPLPACHATISGVDAEIPEPVADLPTLNPGDRHALTWRIVPRVAGDLPVRLTVGQQEFEQSLRVDPPLRPVPAGDYDVPPPRPVETKYRIGVYYFPGWSPEQIGRWRSQDGFPERDPVLGWYEEGRPEVADWHIKWAVENAISFFVFDWYWRDGHEALEKALNDGFLRARYADQMQFALMWANHPPFSDHSADQLIGVTDFWIERYFRRPNYLRVDGSPYVSFFAPGELVAGLGSPEKVKEALDAMRARVREAGLPGLHIGACGGDQAEDASFLARCGFDSVTAYNYLSTGATASQSPYRQYLLGHEPIWRRMTAAESLPYIPLLTVGWDSRPWHGPRAQARFNRRPENLAEALARLRSFLDEAGSTTALLEAWNEWGEGSYIEPNAEFGFRDLEAVRDVFGAPGGRPQNIAPADLGLGGVYDLRGDAAGSRAAATVGAPVAAQGIPHGTVEGLEIRCWDDRVYVAPGQALADGARLCHDGGAVRVPGADIVTSDPLPVGIVDGAVNAWWGGNRLAISASDSRNLVPESYVAGSLRVYDPEEPSVHLEPGRDYLVDDTWGAFQRVDGGRLSPGRRVTASYRLSLRRVDALVLDGTGALRLIPGRPAPDCPELPAVPDGAFLLANVYRPFGATTVEPHHVYIPTGQGPSLTPIRHPALEAVVGRLAAGGSATIVCWGDSVTTGGDASSPSHSYVGLLASMLRERFPRSEVRVANAGVGGSNTAGRLAAFDEEVLAHHPDVVTLEFVNDMGFPAAELETRYVEILGRVRETGAVLVLATPHFTRPDWMGLPNGRGPDPREAVAFLRGFASENGVPLADVSRRWEQLEVLGIPYEALLRNGINHPDDRGHRIYAEELMRFFRTTGLD